METELETAEPIGSHRIDLVIHNASILVEYCLLAGLGQVQFLLPGDHYLGQIVGHAGERIEQGPSESADTGHENQAREYIVTATGLDLRIGHIHLTHFSNSSSSRFEFQATLVGNELISPRIGQVLDAQKQI